ncbi:MAG: hypothetical protein ACOYIP_00025 [Coriobacteriales bacterium]
MRKLIKAERKRPLAKALAIAITLACTLTLLTACTSQEEMDAQALEEAEFTATTTVLEYSDKEVDPLSLVECTDEAVEVGTEDTIDLSSVGDQEVAYTLTLGSTTRSQTATFTVRDTKSPTIKLAKDKVEIDQGGSFDPASNVEQVSDPVDGDLQESSEHLGETEDDPGNQRYYDAGWYAIDGDYDTDAPGTYTLTITACDVHGNRTTKTFELTVAEVAPPEEEPAAEEESAARAAVDQPATHDYVLNTNTKKFHYPDCSSVSDMKSSNRWDVEMTRDEVIDMGYVPCKRCNP